MINSQTNELPVPPMEALRKKKKKNNKEETGGNENGLVEESGKTERIGR